jgi:secreted trypsin-like serine protease
MRHFVLAAVLAGCSTSAPELTVLDGAGPDHTPSNEIYGGSGPDAPEHAAVVSLHQLTSGGSSVYVSPFCTGTLIAPDVVLTAAHCLDTARRGSNFRTMAPDALAIYVGDDPAADIVSHLYTVTETLINPTYNRVALLNDIALVRLSAPITEAVTPVAPLPPAEGLSAADVGSTVNFAGFGQTEFGGSGVKLQVDGTVGGLGCSVPGCFDAGDAATQVSYAQGGGGPCFGDSGGPMFVYRGGTAYVGGITSYGDQYCTQYGVSTRPDAFASLIGDFVGVGPGDTGVGETGIVDTGSPPAGPVCGDGTCDVGESCDGQSGTVACSADCDGKTNGKPSGRYCYVDGVCEGPGC